MYYGNEGNDKLLIRGGKCIISKCSLKAMAAVPWNSQWPQGGLPHYTDNTIINELRYTMQGISLNIFQVLQYACVNNISQT